MISGCRSCYDKEAYSSSPLYELMRKCRSYIVSVLLLLSSAPIQPATGQKETRLTPCQVGRNAAATGFWTWPIGAHVKVYLRMGAFQPEEVQYLLAPLHNWNTTSEITGSGVKFEYAGTTAEELTCEKCMTIMRGHVFDKMNRHVTETQVYSLHRNQIITYAAIVIDPSLTNPQALSNAVAHELGHNLGLLDCYKCRSNTTLMSGFTALNVPNDLEAPTACDIAQVKQAYAELRVRVHPSPVIAKKIDDGEEPIDDDTPIVVPKP
jgi:hypothetical protein